MRPRLRRAFRERSTNSIRPAKPLDASEPAPDLVANRDEK